MKRSSIALRTRTMKRGVLNFINVFRVGFFAQIPKKTANFTVFFALSGSAHIKAAHKTFVKLTLYIVYQVRDESLEQGYFLDQRWAKYGPRAKSGLLRSFVRPAKEKTQDNHWLSNLCFMQKWHF